MGADDEWREPPEDQTSREKINDRGEERIKEGDPLLKDSSNLDEELILKELERILLSTDENGTTTESYSGKLHENDEHTRIEKPSSRKKARDKDSDKKPTTIGGFSFFFSLLALLPTGILTIVLTLYTWHVESLPPTLYFIGSVILGAIVGSLLIRGHFSVLLHEFKHALISNLVGNKAKKLHVEANSGHFEYAYSKETSHYNAFISLAPYIVPLFTFIAGLLALAFGRTDRMIAVAIVGAGYGIDLVLNLRDISPIQTDITEIRGGYKVGLLYISAWNFLLLGLVLAWIFHGLDGFAMLLHEFAALFFFLHNAIRGTNGVEAP
jgi:hypothetical protein